MPFQLGARRTAWQQIQPGWQIILQVTSLLENTSTQFEDFTGIIAAQEI